GLVVATPGGLSNTCGGAGVANNGASSVSLSGVTLAAGASCNLSVNVTATSAGTKNNTVTAASTEGGAGNTSNAMLTVTAAAAPVISKFFSASNVALNGTISIFFTIDNPNADMSLSGISFTDALPSGLVVASPNNLSSNCGGTVTAVAGSSSISSAGATLPASGSCTIIVNLKATTSGVKVNTTGPISSNETGPGATSNTATAAVVAPPSLIKSFGAASLALNGTTTLTFTITNSNTTTVLSDLKFADNLPNGLIVASPNGIAGNCLASGGGVLIPAIVVASPGSHSVTMSSLRLAESGSCSFSVSVTGTQTGNQVNTTGNITGTFDDGEGTSIGITGNTATASINIVP
ncbi:MAG TPA: hypothetical protein VG649_17615, partial [Candidatus Angelobacter sp.]|nr:hypothetical protein [Candidatus Angelobacter sp.]